jgi:hypothetical protein
MKILNTLKISLVFLWILLPVLSWAQNNDYARWNLKGKVKTIKETSYSVNDQHAKDSLEYYFLNEFNSEGNKIVDAAYLPDGKLVKSYSYSYGTNNERTEEKQFDGDGKLIRTISYTYDTKGNLLEDSSIDSQGKPGKKIVFTYDNSGKVIEDNSYGGDGKLQKKFTYTYDDRGNKIETNRFDSNGNPERKTLCNYDAQNNPLEEVSTKPDQTVLKKVNFSYEYDAHNNWIVKTTFVEDKPVNILEREIVYYE